MAGDTATLRGRALVATGFHALAPDRVEILDEALIEIGPDGVITAVTAPNGPPYAERMEELGRAGRLERLPAGHYVLPGFVDCHVHAPQYPQLGNALDVPLEVWLRKYTFPLEARYADLAFARRAYGLLVEDLLANGTTTALYFATVHQEATRLLAETCLEKGQRALVGKVVMDDKESCPDYYRDASTEAALTGTLEFTGHVRALPANAEGLVLPVVTPRFIPSCTDAALEGLGQIARDCGCHVQTHCSESDWEHGYVLSRHGVTDTESLDRFGLLGPKTMLAHSNLITDADMERIRDRQAAIAHCPLSNAYFAGAAFPLRAALEKGLKVGLGSDISGGPSASLFENARAAILMARLLESGIDPALDVAARASGKPARIDFRQAFHIATAGGGRALDLPVGLFQPGYHFDAMVIDPAAERGTMRLFEELDSGEGILQKILYTASRANIAAVYVGGRAVA
jgi:guanine deaminase